MGLNIQKVLIVDDEISIQEILEVFLSEFRFELTLASDGAEALEFCASENFDLIISDISMPKVDGIQFFTTFQNNGGTTPFMFITAYANKEDEIRSFDDQVVAFMAKPITKEELVTKIENMMK